MNDDLAFGTTRVVNTHQDVLGQNQLASGLSVVTEKAAKGVEAQDITHRALQDGLQEQNLE